MSEKSIHANPSMEYKCQYCGKIWITTLSMYHQHEKHCKSNPNRTPWKQEINPYHHTDDDKKKISQTQKENFLNGKSRWNIDRSQTSYAENYFINWLNTFTDYKHNYWTNRFYLDFAWPDKMIYIEVNGEQHYQNDIDNKDYQERDRERYDVLEKEGWKCLSIIRWSWFKSLSEEDKTLFLNDLKTSILTSKVLTNAYMSRKELRTLNQQNKKSKAIELGQIDSKGRINCNKTTKEEINRIYVLLKSSNIDFLKLGWMKKSIELTGSSRKIINKIVKDYNIKVVRQSNYIS